MIPSLLNPPFELLLLVIRLPHHCFLGLVQRFLCALGDLVSLLLGHSHELFCSWSSLFSDLTYSFKMFMLLGWIVLAISQENGWQKNTDQKCLNHLQQLFWLQLHIWAAILTFAHHTFILVISEILPMNQSWNLSKEKCNKTFWQIQKLKIPCQKNI